MFVSFATIKNIKDLQEKYESLKESLGKAFINKDNAEQAKRKLYNKSKLRYKSDKTIRTSPEYKELEQKVKSYEKTIENIKRQMVDIKLEVAHQIKIDEFMEDNNIDDINKETKISGQKTSIKRMSNKKLDELIGWDIDKKEETKKAEQEVNADENVISADTRQSNIYDEDVDIDSDKEFFVVCIVDDDGEFEAYISPDDKPVTSLKKAAIFESKEGAQVYARKLLKDKDFNDINLSAEKLPYKGEAAIKKIDVDNIVESDSEELSLDNFKNTTKNKKLEDGIKTIVNTFEDYAEAYKQKTAVDNKVEDSEAGSPKWASYRKEQRELDADVKKLTKAIKNFEFADDYFTKTNTKLREQLISKIKSRLEIDDELKADSYDELVASVKKAISEKYNSEDDSADEKLVKEYNKKQSDKSVITRLAIEVANGEKTKSDAYADISDLAKDDNDRYSALAEDFEKALLKRRNRERDINSQISNAIIYILTSDKGYITDKIKTANSSSFENAIFFESVDDAQNWIKSHKQALKDSKIDHIDIVTIDANRSKYFEDIIANGIAYNEENVVNIFGKGKKSSSNADADLDDETQKLIEEIDTILNPKGV